MIVQFMFKDNIQKHLNLYLIYIWKNTNTGNGDAVCKKIPAMSGSKNNHSFSILYKIGTLLREITIQKCTFVFIKNHNETNNAINEKN